MKRKSFLILFAVLIVIAVSGCSENSSVLENYETALSELESADLYDVFSKKNETDLIVAGERASILSGNSEWERKETTLSSEYTKEFIIAGYDAFITLDIDSNDEFIYGVGYTFSNCDVEDFTSIMEALMNVYGNPDEQKKDDLGVSLTYNWNGDGCFGFVMYSPLVDSVYFYSIAK